MNAEHFVTDVLDTLTDSYTTLDGKPVQGQAVSQVLRQLRGSGVGYYTKSGRRWRGFSCQTAFEGLLREQGFTLVYGRNARGNRALVVTV